jgi:hypothetical protein
MFTAMDSVGQLRGRLSDYPVAILALPTLLGVIQVRPRSIKSSTSGLLGLLEHCSHSSAWVAAHSDRLGQGTTSPEDQTRFT